MKTHHASKLKIKHFVFAAIAAFALNHSANADTIGVGVPTGSTRNDTYIAAGFEFFAPVGGTTINALGFWDANGTGLLVAHTISIFKYDPGFDPSGYQLVVTATIPAGTVGALVNGYRWVGIPSTALPNNGQGGGYYVILATQDQDTWANSIGSPPYLNPSIGTVSGQGLLDAGRPYTVISSQAIINGTGNTSQGYGGANLAFLTTPPPTQPAATPILWTAQGTFTDNTVLSVAGAASNEVYGVDFGAGDQTTANGYTFSDYATNGNMTLSSGNLYNNFLGGFGGTGDSSFDAVLNNGVYGGNNIYGTLENLTIGQKYNVLAVAADTRGDTRTFGVTDELSRSPSQSYKFPGGTPSVGGYIMGTFTATGTNQLFTVFSGDIQYHAILVEKVPAGAIILVTNTLPSSATVGAGSNIVFTAAFSNSPAVNLQWQFLANGVTNSINAGVVIWTNNGVVASTLTLTSLNVTNSGSYRLEAVDKGNSANIANSAPAPLTVISVITWYAAGTYNNSFSDSSVLALAGAVSNEVYGVNFALPAYGVSEPVITANGYTFDDYVTSGNMSVANTVSYFDSYFNGSTGDAGLDSMLTHGVYGGTANTGTLNNLTVGQAYTVLVLLADTRGGAAGGSVFHCTDGLTVSPGQQYAYANGTPKAGGYIMGTFTAQATNQPLTIINNPGASQYNLVLLEKGIAPPPPIAPTFTTNIHPLLSEVTTGGSVTLSVAAAGSVPLYYKWSNQNGPISGATTNSYLFNAVAGTNYYQVIVTNSAGSVTSSVAAVISSPAIVTVNNFSFEQDVASGSGTIALSPGAEAPFDPTGWTSFGKAQVTDIGSQWAGGTDYTVFSPLVASADENQYCFINMFNPSITGGIYQDVGALQANTIYTLTVAIGSRADRINSPGIISLLNGTDNNGTVLATGGGLPATQDTWQDYTLAFTNGASASGDLTITLSALGDPTLIQADFDNVRLTKASVAPPTPPTLGKPTVSGGNLILTGTDGTPNSGYTWLSTTNLSAPIIWTTNSTGTLDGTGSFSNAIPISATTRASFFRLRIP